eukprot:m.230028 g.230028  ORF g.230028 m.230028 type:complete len:152 (-) comp13890_c1_seq4:312-767(-)
MVSSFLLLSCFAMCKIYTFLCVEKAVQDVGDFITNLLKQHSQTHDTVDLKSKLWVFVVKKAKPNEKGEDVLTNAKKLRKLYKVFSKSTTSSKPKVKAKGIPSKKPPKSSSASSASTGKRHASSASSSSGGRKQPTKRAKQGGSNNSSKESK